jgi:hypothetical protein
MQNGENKRMKKMTDSKEMKKAKVRLQIDTDKNIWINELVFKNRRLSASPRLRGEICGWIGY